MTCVCTHPGQAVRVSHVHVLPPVLRGRVGRRHLAEGLRWLRHTELQPEAQRQQKVHIDIGATQGSEVKPKGHVKGHGGWGVRWGPLQVQSGSPTCLVCKGVLGLSLCTDGFT